MVAVGWFIIEVLMEGSFSWSGPEIRVQYHLLGRLLQHVSATDQFEYFICLIRFRGARRGFSGSSLLMAGVKGLGNLLKP